MVKKISWIVMGVLCLMIGLYPLSYFIFDMSEGLLDSKSDALLGSNIWNIAFYGHIILGGVALFIGWLQFSKKMRLKYLNLHRLIGKIYVISVLISAVCGIYIGYFASGGIISATGFIALGLVWFFSTFRAYQYAKKVDVPRHELMMYFSYAACFAAVTLRIWLPLLISGFGDFIPAYRLVAWLCWVPNLIFAYLLLKFTRPELLRSF